MLPILVELAFPFFLFAAAIVIVGIAETHASAHGTAHTASWSDWLTGKAELKILFGLAAQAASFIASHFAAAQLERLAKWFVQIGTLTGGWFTVVPSFAESVAGALARVEHKALSALAHTRTLAHTLSVFKTHVEATLRHLAHAVTVTIPRDIARIEARVGKLAHAIAITIPRDIARIEHGVDVINHDLARELARTKALEQGAVRTWAWIRANPFSLAATAFAGAVSVALTRLGLNSIRCNNLANQFDKRGCGMWDDIGSLLDLAVAALAFSDLEQLLKVAEEIEVDVITLAKDALSIP